MIKQNNGFTLIELSVVFVIVGLVLATTLPVVMRYNTTKNFIQTRENLKITQEAIREFYGLQGRYPCPADPSLPKSDVNYGVEQCRATLTDACPAGLVCTSFGSRDANGDTLPDPVTIGAVPTKTLADNTLFAKFEGENGRDAYHTKLKYAVSELMTDQGYTASHPANVQLGAIALKDEFGNDVTMPPESAHYVILSHGEDMVGAHTIEGVDVGGCTFFNAVTSAQESLPAGSNIGGSGIKVELENCDDNDAIFVSGLRSSADNDNYFDDMVFFNTNTANVLWRRSDSSPLNMAYIYNTNFGAVGVNETDPVSKLHVNGDIRVGTEIQAEGGYCPLDSSAGSDCFLPEVIGGNAMAACPTGQVATGIENNQLVCVDLFPLGAVSFTCPAGTFLRAFSNMGALDCAAP